MPLKMEVAVFAVKALGLDNEAKGRKLNYLRIFMIYP